MIEIQPDSIKHSQTISQPKLTVEDPKDFSEGGSEHRKGIIANMSLIIVLISSTKLNPKLLGIELSVPMLFTLVFISHVYFFVMWRITASIEFDSEKKFWNIRGIYRQAFLKGTENFPGKLKAQIFFIRALPIWAFIIGLLGLLYGFLRL